MEVSLFALWLPIVLSAIGVFMASSIIWMVLKYHNKDIRFLSNEEAFVEAIKPLNIEPGLYMYPNCNDARDMKSPEFQAKWNAGPWGIINVMNNQPNFVLNMVKTFMTYIVISILVAYIASTGLPAGTAFMEVFRITLTASILGYCLGGLPNSFFLGTPSRFIFTNLADGVIFAFVTSIIFSLLWPGIPA